VRNLELKEGIGSAFIFVAACKKNKERSRKRTEFKNMKRKCAQNKEKIKNADCR
jgi:hypothetical protein